MGEILVANEGGVATVTLNRPEVYNALTSSLRRTLGDELDAIAADRGGRVHYLTGTREQLGGDPLSADYLRALVPDLRRHEVYLCGPPGMTATAIESLQDAGVPRARIHHESFEF